MSEPVVETEVTTDTQTEYESPSFGAMLEGSPNGQDAEAGLVEVEAEAEGLEGDRGLAPSEEPSAATAETQPAQTNASPEPSPATAQPQAIDVKAEVAKATQGLIAALQAERARRQEYEAQLGETVPVDQAQSEVQSLKNQMLEMSEAMARIQYKDYDEVVREFHLEAAQNPALAETVINAKVPAVAAYQAGLNIKMMREFGPEVIGNPYALVQKVREKAEIEAKEKLTKEFQSKLSARASERNKTPTDISQARSTGGVAQPYQSPSFSELLGSALKR